MNCSATEHVPCKLNNGIERKHQMERFERSEPKVAGLGLSQLPGPVTIKNEAMTNSSVKDLSNYGRLDTIL